MKFLTLQCSVSNRAVGVGVINPRGEGKLFAVTRLVKGWSGNAVIFPCLQVAAGEPSNQTGYERPARIL